MKKLLQTLLRWISAMILWRYRPAVIAITGSVGKTSAKDAVFHVVSGRYRTRASRGNYNNEIGVPLTVIGSEAAGRNVIQWIFIFLKGILVFIFHPKYPELLVVEVGADRPGDLPYLMSFVHPNISIVTAVGPSHLEFFGKVEKIAQEKSQIVKALPVSGIALLNRDDDAVYEMRSKNKGTTVAYGFHESSDIRATDASVSDSGLIFKVSISGKSIPIEMPNVLSRVSIYAALAALGVADELGINLLDAANALKTYQNPPGRMRLLAGVKRTKIIDDTYNSAPASAAAALRVLSDLSGERKIAVLGDMEELGQFTEEGHREVGAAAVDVGVNFLFTVGPKAKFISDQARHMGFPDERILEFATSEEAQKPLKGLIEPGDVILIKGSQSQRMERIVKEIMAEPHRAADLLVRQSPGWFNKL